jgi:hypothetical protein
MAAHILARFEQLRDADSEAARDGSFVGGFAQAGWLRRFARRA